MPTQPPNHVATFARSGLGDFRMTKQRKVVYDVLMQDRVHPTASEVFLRAKHLMPSISLATVYNCLETMTQAGLIKQVNVDRDASRYCPNLRPHAHFHCSSCLEIFDIDLKPGADASAAWDLPEKSSVEHLDVAMKGVCPRCQETGHAFSSPARSSASPLLLS